MKNIPNNRVVVMAGADRVGKSSIAKEIAKQHGLQYFKHTSQTENFKDAGFYNTAYVEGYYLIDLLSQLSLEGNGVILDRHIPCEYAYALATERPISIPDIIKIDAALSELGAVLIYCEKDYRNFDYKDDLVSLDLAEKVKKYYHEYLDNVTSMSFLYLDTTDEDLEDQMDKVSQFFTYV